MAKHEPGEPPIYNQVIEMQILKKSVILGACLQYVGGGYSDYPSLGDPYPSERPITFASDNENRLVVSKYRQLDKISFGHPISAADQETVAEYRTRANLSPTTDFIPRATRTGLIDFFNKKLFFCDSQTPSFFNDDLTIRALINNSPILAETYRRFSN